MNESRSSSSSRRSRKIHGYGLRDEEEEEAEQISYTQVQPQADKKDGKTYTKKYLPQALKADGSAEAPLLD